ncbi:MAG: hypothetical protein ACHQ9S_18870 [Candidatus Binatia bacterium]
MSYPVGLILWADNASTTLASGITNVATSCTVAATTGQIFPNPGANQFFVATLEDTSGNIEVVAVTGRSTDTMTIVRAVEAVPQSGGGVAATALAFASGSRFEIRCTSGMLSQLLQKTGYDTLTGTTNLAGVLALGGSGSIQGGEYTGFVRSGAGVTAGQFSVNSGNGYLGTITAPNQVLTAGNIGTAIAPLTSGLDVCRTNMIVMWYGSVGAIPSGWHLCDGTSGTPNLTDHFIVSAKSGGALVLGAGTYVGNTGNGTSIASNTGTHALTTAELAAHNHANTIYGGNGGQVVGPGGTASGSFYFFGASGAGVAINWNTSNNGSGTAHGHTTPDVVHTHTQSIPYYGLLFIMKL